jgi:putative membrane protein
VEADFFAQSTAKSVEAAVKEIEAQTAAEIVVCVRRRIAAWRAVDFAVGALLAMVVLCVLIYHPAEFTVWTMPLEVAGAGLVGALLSMPLTAHRRLLVPARVVVESSLRAARAAFVELGVSRTSGRTGLLVVVFVAERRVELVGDLAVDVAKLDAARQKIAAAVARLDAEGFAKALTSLGPLLAPLLPRAVDDVNELPDAPVMS